MSAAQTPPPSRPGRAASLPGASPKLRVLCAQLLALAGRAGDVLEAAAALERSCEAEAVGEAATLRAAAEQLAAVCMFPFGTAATQDAAWKEVAALLEVRPSVAGLDSTLGNAHHRYAH